MGTPRLPRSYNIIYRFRQGRCYAGNVIVSTLQLARPTHAKNQNAGTFPNQKKKKNYSLGYLTMLRHTRMHLYKVNKRSQILTGIRTAEYHTRANEFSKDQARASNPHHQVSSSACRGILDRDIEHDLQRGRPRCRNPVPREQIK